MLGWAKKAQKWTKNDNEIELTMALSETKIDQDDDGTSRERIKMFVEWKTFAISVQKFTFIFYSSANFLFMRRNIWKFATIIQQFLLYIHWKPSKIVQSCKNSNNSWTADWQTKTSWSSFRILLLSFWLSFQVQSVNWVPLDTASKLSLIWELFRV